MSGILQSPSLWRDVPAWRWLVVLASLNLGLGLVGMPWLDTSERAPATVRASFDGSAVAVASQHAAPYIATPAPLPDPAPTLPSATEVPALSPSPIKRQVAGSKQAYSAVTWMATQFQPIEISGGGLTASASSGGTHTALASRGVAQGRHYLELTLSIPAGEGGPSTWSGLGVVPATALQGGRVFMPSITAGFSVSTGRHRKLRDGDVIMLAIDLQDRLAFWGMNGEWMNGVPGAQGGQSLQSSAGDQWTPFVNVTASERNRTPPQGGERWIANFGASRFKYALPVGFDSYGSVEASAQASTSSRPHAATQPAPIPTPLANALIGKRYQDLFRIQGQAIPLPTGTWTVLAHFRDSGVGSARGDAVVLAKLDGNKLAGVIAINALEAGKGVAPFEACNRQDYVFRHVDTYEAQGNQRCWWINHAVAMWQTQSVFQAASLELARLGIGVPSVMLNVGFRRADKAGFATTFYYFDPSSDGIVTAPTSWAESEWHRARIDADPRRVAYVKRMQHWGESWAPIYFASK